MTEHIVVMAPKLASGTGALDGFEASCSCGWKFSSSFRSEISMIAWEHVQYFKNKENGLTIYDICPNIGDYIQEVEKNGNKITKDVVVDVLMDFAKFPPGITQNEIQSVIRKMAERYTEGWV